MKVRQVLLAMVIVGIVGGLIALPWIYVHSRSASPGPTRTMPQPLRPGAFATTARPSTSGKHRGRRNSKPTGKSRSSGRCPPSASTGLAKEAAGVVIDMVREHCRELGADRLLDEQDSDLQRGPHRPGAHRTAQFARAAGMPEGHGQERVRNQFARVIAQRRTCIRWRCRCSSNWLQGDNADWSTLALQTLANGLQKKTPSGEIETAVLDAVKKGKHARKFLDTLQRVLAADKSPSEPVQARDKYAPIGRGPCANVGAHRSAARTGRAGSGGARPARRQAAGLVNTNPKRQSREHLLATMPICA